jgi:ribosomal protein S18 acetylase RimI-like enzyme
MLLEVAIDNVAAQRLYAAEGFERVGMRADYYLRSDGTRSSAYTMRCELKPQLAFAEAAARAS